MAEQCIICEERPKEVRLQCGHLFACSVCVSKLERCAMCREEITAGYNVLVGGLSDSDDSSQEVEVSSDSNTVCTSSCGAMESDWPGHHIPSISTAETHTACRHESAEVAWSLGSEGQSTLEGKEAIESPEMLRNDDRDAPASEPQDFMENPLMIALADRCIKKNSILAITTDVLVSGIDSTMLAWLAFHVCQQWHGKHKSDEPQKALFIAPTVPVARQQYEVAVKFFGRMKPQLIIGTAEVDNIWKKAEWQQAISKYDTILTTPQLLLDVLNAKYVSLSIFSTLVVNECQHCSGRHPLSLIFSNYYVKLDPSTVRVLGLSRRLVKHNVSEPNTKSVIQKLESVMRSSVINWEAEIVRCNELAKAIV